MPNPIVRYVIDYRVNQRCVTDLFEGAGGFMESQKRKDELLNSRISCSWHRQIYTAGEWRTTEVLR